MSTKSYELWLVVKTDDCTTPEDVHRLHGACVCKHNQREVMDEFAGRCFSTCREMAEKKHMRGSDTFGIKNRGKE